MAKDKQTPKDRDQVQAASGLKNIPKPRRKKPEGKMPTENTPESLEKAHVGYDVGDEGGDKSVTTLVAPVGLSSQLESHASELFDTPKRSLNQRFWGMVWNASEASGIGLGRFAPTVFHRMIGAKERKEVKS